VKTVEILLTQSMVLEPTCFTPSDFHGILVHRHASKCVRAAFVMLPTSPLVVLPENLFPPAMVTMVMPRSVNHTSCGELALICQTI